MEIASAGLPATGDLAALVRNCSRVSVGAPTGTSPPDSVGDCTFRPPREYGTAAMLFDALRGGAVTAAWTATAATGVPGGVVVLVDRKPALIPVAGPAGPAAAAAPDPH